ncbi:histidinol dehydrogenase [Pseudoalteromonas denitrificans]|uniref:Histidinol dehydrogenase n=1 Tax=Pseudoalteromonas denitrificans DSM 6059 TaxID=1123010 RepID=A0A1I1GT24_9GAMM|nr:histidinol dehydrogenase [Pseudoalteromonas denitrificans]SFC14656.1 histidinol dehydrogenase [Pseudoalteromonas denitrificans DSM 6059]
MFNWNEETNASRESILQRPAIAMGADIKSATQIIIDQVKDKGDEALLQLAKKFDNVYELELMVSMNDIDQAQEKLSPELKSAIECAYDNIVAFHTMQQPKDIKLETIPGVLCELKYQAIEAVGIYVPGGSAPLPSSVLMQGVLAQLSGAKTVVLATPVKNTETLNPAILYAAKLCGIKTILKSGGAGAIAALAFGTQSVPAVNKIFGPGNAFVTMAKQLVSSQVPGLAIDMPAGPSEVLIIADKRANPDFIAADLLSQAEHGKDSQVILISNASEIIEKTQLALAQQLKTLSRAEIAMAALDNSAYILVDTITQAFEVSAIYGPEHLILQLANCDDYLPLIKNAGSVFVGDYSPESAGDYASGTNHVLPTYGYSKVYSSLNLLDFYRTYTVQTITKQGLTDLSSAILPIAAAEGLDAHAHAVSIRLEKEVC